MPDEPDRTVQYPTPTAPPGRAAAGSVARPTDASRTADGPNRTTDGLSHITDGPSHITDGPSLTADASAHRRSRTDANAHRRSRTDANVHRRGGRR